MSANHANPWERTNVGGWDRKTVPDLSRPVDAEQVAARLRALLDSTREQPASASVTEPPAIDLMGDTFNLRRR